MSVTINFGVPYKNILSLKSVEIELDSDKASILNVMERFFKEYPEAKDKLAEKKFIKDDMIKALFVVKSDLVGIETVVADGSEIDVLIPMAGG